MQKMPVNKSLSWFQESKIPPGSNPLLDLMKAEQIPLTRQNYLEIAYPDEDPNSFPAELESELPEFAQQQGS